MTATVAGPRTQFVRARTSPEQGTVPRARARTAEHKNDFQAVAQHMFSLMVRNVTTDGFMVSDPSDPARLSRPGCVVAAPTYPGGAPGVDQDYIFNWVRDAALTAFELEAVAVPPGLGTSDQTLIDYVNFARGCQQNAAPTLAHACFTIDGQSRPWTEQSDGPALQTLAIMTAWPHLDQPTQQTALSVISTNLDFLLGAYTEPTTNLWEEHWGYSFFARSAQLRCLRAVAANTIGITVPPGTQEAIAWLSSALAGHWNGSCYLSMLAPEPGEGPSPVAVVPGYDPNIDIVQASIYGAVPCTDTKLLATAARLRQQWSDPSSDVVYPINVADERLGMGPMMGRYPADTYDGDVADPVLGGHPWALSTCNVAELYYNLASEVQKTGAIPRDDLSEEFFSQLGIGAGASARDAVASLEQAGDAMLQAVIYHSDHLELSEQFDGTTGFEKSVRDLTWSYAAFLSAVRARNARSVQG